MQKTARISKMLLTYRPTRQALESRVRDYKLLELRLTSIVDFEREKGKLIGEAKNEG